MKSFALASSAACTTLSIVTPPPNSPTPSAGAPPFPLAVPAVAAAAAPYAMFCAMVLRRCRRKHKVGPTCQVVSLRGENHTLGLVAQRRWARGCGLVGVQEVGHDATVSPGGAGCFKSWLLG